MSLTMEVQRSKGVEFPSGLAAAARMSIASSPRAPVQSAGRSVMYANDQLTLRYIDHGRRLSCTHTHCSGQSSMRPWRSGQRPGPVGPSLSSRRSERGRAKREEGRGKKAFLFFFFFSLPLCRSVSRVLPVAREGGEAGGRDGWMDHYRLMLCVLARSHSRRAACPPPARASSGWAGRDGHEGKMGSHAKRIQEEPQTNGRTDDGRTDGRMDAQLAVSDLVFRSLPPSLRPDRMSV